MQTEKIIERTIEEEMIGSTFEENYKRNKKISHLSKRLMIVDNQADHL